MPAHWPTTVATARVVVPGVPVASAAVSVVMRAPGTMSPSFDAPISTPVTSSSASWSVM